MTKSSLMLGRDTLKNLSGLVIVQGSNRLIFSALSFHEKLGFQGGSYLNIKHASLEEVASSIDASFAKGAGKLKFATVDPNFPVALLRNALAKDGQVQGFKRESLDDLKLFAEQHLSRRAVDYICADEEPMRMMNFLGLGDRDARLQALEAFPMRDVDIITSPDARAIIDARAPLVPLIHSFTELQPVELKRYLQIEKVCSKEIRAAKTISAISNVQGRIHTLQHCAEVAARLVKAEQIPEDFEGLRSMLQLISNVRVLALELKTGLDPFKPFVSIIKSDQWEGAKCALQDSIPKTEMRDYIRCVSKALSSAILVDLMRKNDSIDMDWLSTVSSKILEKAEVSEDEAEFALKFSNFLGGYEYRSLSFEDQIAGIIGQHASLKDLREMQTRWHHVQQTMANEVLATREDLDWDPLVGSVDLPGGRAVELSSSGALEAQGKREQHCVGGYTAAVMSGTSKDASVIFSIEAGDKILSTIEVSVSLDDDWGRRKTPKLACTSKQHRACRNSSPSPEASAMAGKLVATLNKLPVEQVIGYLSGMSRNTGQLRERLQGAIVKAGINICNPGIPETVLGTYDEVLPRALRGKDIGFWADQVREAASLKRIEAMETALAAAFPAPIEADLRADPEPAPASL